MQDALVEGLVVRAFGWAFDVHIGDRTVRCELRGRLKASERKTTSPVCVGDRVQVALHSSQAGTIEEIGERRSKLSRKASGTTPFEQVIAANLDQLVIVAATQTPKLRLGLVDRLVVTALTGNMAPVLCINKMDLVASRDGIERVVAPYRELGYPVLLTSALTGEGLHALSAQLKDRLSAFVGQSGVGKSFLLNVLEPGLGIKTQGLMARNDRGKHTTASAALHPLSGGGYVADTPGIKELGLWGVDTSCLLDLFPDLRSALTQCRFRNCAHIHEPGCSLKAAVESGRAPRERYESYLRMLRSLEKP